MNSKLRLADEYQLLIEQAHTLLERHRVPLGLCDAQGNWLVKNQALQACIDPEAAQLRSLFCNAEHWYPAWRRVLTNQQTLLHEWRLAAPLADKSLRSTRVDIELLQQSVYLFELLERGECPGERESQLLWSEEMDSEQVPAHPLSTELQCAVIQSLTDTGTGIPNRRAFYEYLTRQWQHALKESCQLSVVLVNIELPVADSASPVAEQLLAQLAQCISSVARRPADLVARIGAAEFGLVLPNTEVIGAQSVSEDLLTKLQQLALEQASTGVGDPPRALIGSSTLNPDWRTPIPQLLQQADLALCRARQSGRLRALHFHSLATREEERWLALSD